MPGILERPKPTNETNKQKSELLNASVTVVWVSVHTRWVSAADVTHWSIWTGLSSGLFLSCKGRISSLMLSLDFPLLAALIVVIALEREREGQ